MTGGRGRGLDFGVATSVGAPEDGAAEAEEVAGGGTDGSLGTAERPGGGVGVRSPAGPLGRGVGGLGGGTLKERSPELTLTSTDPELPSVWKPAPDDAAEEGRGGGGLRERASEEGGVTGSSSEDQSTTTSPLSGGVPPSNSNRRSRIRSRRRLR